MVSRIAYFTSSTKNIESNGDDIFMVENSGIWLKITTDAVNFKDKIINFLKQCKYEFYVLPDLISLLKAVISCLPNNITQEILLQLVTDFGLVL